MAKELELKYGCNPNQKPSRIFMADGSELPIEVLNGKPGYINFLDAFNSWQLVKELKEATGLPAAASFKHVSPAGAAVGLPLTDVLRKIYFTGDQPLSALACAYVRARGAGFVHRQRRFGHCHPASLSHSARYRHRRKPRRAGPGAGKRLRPGRAGTLFGGRFVSSRQRRAL